MTRLGHRWRVLKPKKNPDDIYVQETLLQVMVDEFDTVIDDGSAESVAADIVKLWEETQAGKAGSGLVVKFWRTGWKGESETSKCSRKGR